SRRGAARGAVRRPLRLLRSLPRALRRRAHHPAARPAARHRRHHRGVPPGRARTAHHRVPRGNDDPVVLRRYADPVGAPRPRAARMAGGAGPRRGALPMTETKTEVCIDRITSAANPLTFERVPAGAVFAFVMVLEVRALPAGLAALNARGDDARTQVL